MKRIVICLDGTWNQVANPDEVTNVVKLAQAVKSRAATNQIVYYSSGVGAGGRLDRLLGGLFGFGLKRNVLHAYSFLTLNFEPGDEIYIVGFSRGAYTARALAAIINAVGVLRRREFRQLGKAWDYYRAPPAARRSQPHDERSEEPSPAAGLFRRQPTPDQAKAVRAIEDHRHAWFWPAEVKALGVWDTVGSYGVPSGFGLSAAATNFARHRLNFHDRRLGAKVRHAFHAVAIDEARRPFQPTFWTHPAGSPPPANVEQAWFPGVHSDVGGGYRETGLSDLALVWMVDRMAGAGLEFDKAVLRDLVDPCPTCPQHRSGLWWRFLAYRRPLFDERPPYTDREGRLELVINERLHWSVAQRVSADSHSNSSSYVIPGLDLPRLASLPTSAVGPIEAELLGMPRSAARPHGWRPEHERCWAERLPEGFPPREGAAVS